MAAHLQQQLLDAYHATLAAAGTSAAGNVYLERFDPLPEALLPAILIDGGAEDVQSEGFFLTAIQSRNFNFTTTAVCKAATGAAAQARNLAKEIEIAFFASANAADASQKAKSLRLLGSEPEKDENALQELFKVTQQWQATYTTSAGVPDTPF